jgi:hypothetical protein
MTFSPEELRAGATNNGYLLLFTQAELDALPVKAIVLDNDAEACQKDKSPDPFRSGPVELWYIAGHEKAQPPNLPAALVWDPTMISARKVLAGR